MARTSSGVRSENVALARLAVLLKSIAIEIGFAHLTVETIRVVETLKTLASLRIAITRSVQIRVVATLTGLTPATGYLGIPVVIVGAYLATRPGVT